MLEWSWEFTLSFLPGVSETSLGSSAADLSRMFLILIDRLAIFSCDVSESKAKLSFYILRAQRQFAWNQPL